MGVQAWRSGGCREGRVVEKVNKNLRLQQILDQGWLIPVIDPLKGLVGRVLIFRDQQQ